MDIATAKHLGAFLYVQKPSSYSEFVKTIRKILLIDLKIPQPAALQFAGEAGLAAEGML
jgi:hypothetical protein